METHGQYNPVTEIGANTYSNIKKLNLIYQDDNYIAVIIENLEGKPSTFVFAFNDANNTSNHQIKIEGKDIKWKGPFTLIK